MPAVRGRGVRKKEVGKRIGEGREAEEVEEQVGEKRLKSRTRRSNGRGKAQRRNLDIAYFCFWVQLLWACCSI